MGEESKMWRIVVDDDGAAIVENVSGRVIARSKRPRLDPLTGDPLGRADRGAVDEARRNPHALFQGQDGHGASRRNGTMAAVESTPRTASTAEQSSTGLEVCKNAFLRKSIGVAMVEA